MRKRLFVAIGMMAAVVTLLVLWLHLADLHLPLPDGDDPGSRLAFAARWLLLPALALFAGIVVVANQRFFVADAIDGARTSQSRLIDKTSGSGRSGCANWQRVGVPHLFVENAGVLQVSGCEVERVAAPK